MKRKISIILVILVLSLTGCSKEIKESDIQLEEINTEETTESKESIIEIKGPTLEELLKSGYAMTGFNKDEEEITISFIYEVPDEITNTLMEFKGKTISEIKDTYNLEITGHHKYDEETFILYSKINNVMFYTYIKDASLTDEINYEEINNIVIENIDSIMIQVEGKVLNKDKELEEAEYIMQHIEENKGKYIIELEEIKLKKRKA